MIFLYTVVPIVNLDFDFGDTLTDFVLLIAITMLFWQWKEAIMLYISVRFLDMLRGSEQRHKLTYYARVHNLARGIFTSVQD